ncbi:MAG: hypothetical protein BroJett040_22210 [Oligoflexia bacterium]|nr:MAG: hypothetical protein BroJett040_22210 [Oligoflexia bacterium]
MKSLKIFGLIASLLVVGSFAQARGGGGHSLQFGLGLMAANQDGLNQIIDGLGVTGTKNLTSGYEITFDYGYRFSSSMFALKFRPSYYTNSASGGGAETKLTGYTFFPMLRLIPLENSFMKFFLQGGVGYGSLSGSLSYNGASVDFGGGSFGGMAGLGADFCFTDSHCLTIEGNIRYLPIQRNLVSASTGTVSSRLTYSGNELEYDNSDVATTLSGIQGLIAYTLNF